MEQPSPRVVPAGAPTFYIAGRQPLRPEAVLLAIVVACTALYLISHGLHGRARKHRSTARTTGQSSGSSSSSAEDDEDDDPSQIDTIVLGDAADAPVPARRGQRASNVHATVIVHLPRFGQQVGLIPDTPSGHLLFRWLAAFNQGSSAALTGALPSIAPESAAAAQMAMRVQTGGFNLLSAREVQPGVLVFRLRDQTPQGVEVLGTLTVLPGSNPPAVGSFSLRSVPAEPLAAK